MCRHGCHRAFADGRRGTHRSSQAKLDLPCVEHNDVVVKVLAGFVVVDLGRFCAFSVGEGLWHRDVTVSPCCVVDVVRLPFAFGLALGRRIGGGPRPFAFGLARALVPFVALVRHDCEAIIIVVVIGIVAGVEEVATIAIVVE